MKKIWLFYVLVLASCGTLSPHQNFKDHLKMNVGGLIDNPWEPGIALPEYLQSSKILSNGNVENEYRHRYNCRYFFEFDPETRIIVGWRFEGSENDCAIAP